MHFNNLSHHGIKGQKWGVRRYQNKDDTLTNAGRKRYASGGKHVVGDRSDMVKKLANDDFDAANKLHKLSADTAKRMAAFKKPSVWWDENNNPTKEAREYWKKTEKEYDKFSDKQIKLYDEIKREKTSLLKGVFLADDVKPSLLQAKQIRAAIDELYDNTVGYKSKAYEDAFIKYKKEHPDHDDVEYGFDHYYWPRSKEREQAVKEYDVKSSALNKQYTELITGVGKTVTQGFSDQRIPNWCETYADWGRDTANEIIRFNTIKLD